MAGYSLTRKRALRFQSTTLTIVRRDGEPMLRAGDIAAALGYSRADAVARLFDRNRTEFTDGMQGVVKLTTPGGEQPVQVFSLRGAHLLAMFARTEQAAAFRRWVLDLLDEHAQAPVPTLAPPPRWASQRAQRVSASRYTADIAPDGRMTLTPWQADTVAGTPDELARAIAQSGWRIDDVLRMHQACTQAMQAFCAHTARMRDLAAQVRQHQASTPAVVNHALTATSGATEAPRQTDGSPHDTTPEVRHG